MKREHIETLWEHYDTGCLGPPFQPLPLTIWDDLIERKVVKNVRIVKDAKPFENDDPKFDQSAQEKSCFYGVGPGSPLIVLGFQAEELTKLVTEGMLHTASIDEENLANLTAEHWGLTPCLWELDFQTDMGGTLIIGWKDENTAVVITDFSNKFYTLQEFLFQIKSIIEQDIEDIKYEISRKSDTVSNTEGPFVTDDLKCDTLYVLNTRQSEPRTIEVESILEKEGIICIGFHDFLTINGMPKWSARAKPIPVISYSEPQKDFLINGKPIELNPTERIIFRILWENMDKYIDQEDLMTVVWPIDCSRKKRRTAKRVGEPEWPESTLFTHISYLRKKLEETGFLTITNTKGKGYKLNILT